MANVPYIDYKTLREFYTIGETCDLFLMKKSELQQKCMLHDVQPRRNEIGEYGFVKYDIRKLHNLIYHESSSENGKDDDPWA